MPARGLSFDAARGDGLQDVVDDFRERPDSGFVGLPRNQDQREVMAQPRQVAEAGQQPGPQLQPFGGLQAGAHPLAGQVEGNMRLEFWTHERISPFLPAARS